MFWRRNKRPEGRAVDHLPHVTGKGSPPPELLDLPLGPSRPSARPAPSQRPQREPAVEREPAAELETADAAGGFPSPPAVAPPPPPPPVAEPARRAAPPEPEPEPSTDLQSAASGGVGDAPAQDNAGRRDETSLWAAAPSPASAGEASADAGDADAVAAELEAALAAVADFDDPPETAADAFVAESDAALEEVGAAAAPAEPSVATEDDGDGADAALSSESLAGPEPRAPDAAEADATAVDAIEAADDAPTPDAADVAGARADDESDGQADEPADAESEAPVGPPPPDPVRDAFFHTPDGLELFYREYTPQPADPNAPARETPVLCLHGLTRNGRDYEEVAPRLAALGRRVIVPDQRGRGKSDWDANPDHYQPGYYVGDMLGLLGSLDVGPVVVLGASMGGLMAMMLASAQPGKVVGAIINDIGPDLGAEGLERIRAYIGGGPAAEDWADAARMTREVHGPSFPTMRHDEAFWDMVARRLYRQTPDGRILLDYDPAIAGPFLEEAESGADLWPFFEALKEIPTLVIRGELSDLLGRDTVAKMRLRKLDLKTVEAPAVGHAPLLTEPEVWSSIEEFLDAVP